MFGIRQVGNSCGDAFLGLSMESPVRPPRTLNSRGLASAGCVGRTGSGERGCASAQVASAHVASAHVATAHATKMKDIDSADRDLVMIAALHKWRFTSHADQPAKATLPKSADLPADLPADLHARMR